MKRFTITLCLLMVIGMVFGQRKTENLIIITLDGLRWQELYTGADSSLIGDKEYVDNPEELKKLFWKNTATERRQALMPFFWSTLASEGQLYGDRNLGSKVNCSNGMWFSYPGYNEILCGFADDKNINSNKKIPNPNKTVLEFFNGQKGLKGKVAAFGSWDVFPYIINEERSGVPVNAGFESATGKDLTEREKFLNQLQKEIPSPWGGVRLDAFTHHFAKEYIQKNQPRVVYIAYGETDDFAHNGNYQAYLKSAHQTDQFIKELWDYVQHHPQYKNKTTFLITTDHGRGTVPKETWKSHGTDIEGADQIWFAIIGPDTPALGVVKSGQYYQNQFAKTAAALLGYDYKNERQVGDAVYSMIE
ncbi:sulfatase-like hydrolase/transferase [Fulvivirga ulvae]|uniref:sulfatase-like hydrolase/transferase n=1 Tax=Fulvivirga ulvae TaxID=2904245 RepID=UPI001F343BC2|nr:sulfatase-like hydrolase/transferase [Fulvivirga ulvae]UII29583.1 sulfatase-like hydrolase/transferase [Fulvivirga ulvae]